MGRASVVESIKKSELKSFPIRSSGLVGDRIHRRLYMASPLFGAFARPPANGRR